MTGCNAVVFEADAHCFIAAAWHSAVNMASLTRSGKGVPCLWREVNYARHAAVADEEDFLCVDKCL